MSDAPNCRPRLVISVTDPMSLVLMEGLPSHLAASGWEVHVVVGGRPVAVPGAHVHQLGMARRPAPARDLLALVRWVVLLLRLRPDVVMAGTPKAGLLGSIAARVTGVERRVYVLRGLRMETTRGVARVALWVLERLAFLAANEVLAVSQSLAARAAQFGLDPARKLRVLGAGSSNGVDIERYRPIEQDERLAARRALGFAVDQFVVGYVGRIHPDKGLETLIEVVADPEMADKVVVVVAGGVEDADLEPRLAALGARCVRLGHVKNPATVYAAMDVLCLPSRREGFPNVVIEAAARGIPAIVSDATGCRDSVIDGQTGWIFSTNSVPDLKRRILAARSDGTRRAQFGRAARARAVADFDRPKVWAHIDSFLRGDERYTAASHHHVERRLG